MSIKEITNRHKKAVRNMEKAREILRTKAGMEDDEHYQEVKYVKKACGIAWRAALPALDTYLEINGKAIKTKSKDVTDYRRALRDDQEMYNYYNTTWNALHCAGYYNGILNSITIDAGLEAADAIIKAIEPSA